MLWHNIYFNSHFSFEYINFNVAKNARKIDFNDSHQNLIILFHVSTETNHMQIDVHGQNIKFSVQILLQEYSRNKAIEIETKTKRREDSSLLTGHECK